MITLLIIIAICMIVRTISDIFNLRNNIEIRKNNKAWQKEWLEYNKSLQDQKDFEKDYLNKKCIRVNWEELWDIVIEKKMKDLPEGIQTIRGETTGK